MRILRLVVPLLLVAGCMDDHEIRLSLRDDDFEEHLWVNYLRGDTVQLYAREVQGEGDPTATASASAPDLYTWATETPDVVQVIGPGRLVMKGAGAANVSVRGPHSARRFTVWSYPPDAQVRFSPRDTTVNVGDLVTITVTVIDGAGQVFQTNDQRQATFSVAWGSNITAPVLVVLNPSDSRYWQAVRSGSTTITGGISLYNRFTLRDSVNLIVR